MGYSKQLAAGFLKAFGDTAYFYRGRILLMGAFAGWLWSFPLYGPVLQAAGAGRGPADTDAVVTAFLVMHAAGLPAAGYLLSGKIKTSKPFFYLPSLACALLTASFAVVSPRFWPGLGGMLGLAAAVFVVAWGRGLGAEVEADRRGRVVALSFLAGALLNGAQFFAAGMAAAEAALLVSSLLLLVPAFTALGLPPDSGPAPCSGPSAGPLPPVAWLNNWWRFALLVPLFYLVGGLMHQVIQPAAGRDIPCAGFLGTFSYGIACLAAGFLADRAGRRHLPLAGVGLVGTAFVLFALWPVAPVYVLLLIIVQAGYACLDLFIFVYLADRAGGEPSRTARFFGWGLGLNVLSVLGGAQAGSLLQAPRLAEHPVQTALVASLALFITFPFLAGLPESLGQTKRSPGPAGCSAREPGASYGPEPFPGPGAALEAAAGAAALPPAPETRQIRPENPLGQAACSGTHRPDGAESCPGDGDAQVVPHLLERGLTPREIEITLLALQGLDNSAISSQLNISKNTLKTHFRNIYKKSESSGRVSLILWVQELKKDPLPPDDWPLS